MLPPVLILHAPGTNRDREAAWAIERAGGAPEIVHVEQLATGARSLSEFRMLLVPGGFSYGDDLGAGKLWATTLSARLGDELDAFVDAGRPVLGICNGFQVLVKAGLLPGPGLTVERAEDQLVTLHRNDSARFECRWVWLEPDPASPCVFTHGLDEPIHCPVAHGEGRVVARDVVVLAEIERGHLGALRYVVPEQSHVHYPMNPNGSDGNIAGLTNVRGNVLGLMPHPEDHIVPWQHPRWHRGARGARGLPLFERGVRYAAQCT